MNDQMTPANANGVGKATSEATLPAVSGSAAAHVHEWHAITRLTNGWQDVCVTCGEHRIQLWCAMCGKYGNHTSGSCPELKPQNAVITHAAGDVKNQSGCGSALGG